MEPRLFLSAAPLAYQPSSYHSIRAEQAQDHHLHFRAPLPPVYRAPVISVTAPTKAATEPVAAPAGFPALTAPVASLVTGTATEIDLTATAPTGGSGIYTYQWYRGGSAGFVPSAGTLLAGATSRTLADTANLAPDTPYFYVLAANDGISTIYSNQVIGALAIPTTPVNLPYQAGPVMLAYIGSSTWAINQGSGQIPFLINGNLRTAFPSASFTTDNGAVSGTTTASFLPGSTLSNAVKSAVMSFQGYKVLRLMIGSNDAAQGRPLSGWLANMQTIIQDALTWPVDRIVLEEIGLRLDGGNATLDLIRQYNAARGSLVGPKVVLGTTCTYENQALHLSTLSGDLIHQTNAGQIDLASNQTAEMTALFTAPVVPVGAAYYVSLDLSHTYVQVTQGASPGGALLNKYLLLSATPLTLNLSNPGDAVYIDFANGSPVGAGITVSGGSTNQGKLYILSQSPSQVFNMTDTQITLAAGGAGISFQNISELDLLSGVYNYSGNLSTLGTLNVGIQAAFNWS
jgi:hypothetical protein